MTLKKQLWLLVGGNGAGKTTFYKRCLEPRGMQFVNADDIAKTLGSGNMEHLSYRAAKIAEQLRENLLLKGTSFCFETVFSHPSKIDFLAEAKARGYEVVLVFVHLENSQLNQARVVQRVSEGGHNVPMEKVISRIPRTLINVRTALPLVNEAYILDNSLRSAPFQKIAVVKFAKLTVKKPPLPDWAASVLKDYLPG